MPNVTKYDAPIGDHPPISRGHKGWGSVRLKAVDHKCVTRQEFIRVVYALANYEGKLAYRDFLCKVDPALYNAMKIIFDEIDRDNAYARRSVREAEKN